MTMRFANLLILLFFTSLFSGCSDLSVDTEVPEQKQEVTDSVSGVYYLSGLQINKEVCYMGSVCEPGEELDRDTVHTSFTVQVEIVEEKEDTLLFTGLEGANAGIRKALPEDCEKFVNDCAYANITDENIEFDFHRPAGKYFGTGILIDEHLELNTIFSDRGIRIEYELTGSKIEGNL